MKVGFALLLLAVCISSCLATPSWYSISQNGGKYVVTNGKVENSIAEAYFDSDVTKTGWATLGLYTRSNQPSSPSIKAYAAGFLEGFITAEMIWPSYVSTMASSFGQGNKMPAATAKFLSDNIAWTKAQISSNSGSLLWSRVGYTVQMLQGMVDGYNAAISDASKQLTLLDLWVLNSNGDLEEITQMEALSRKTVNGIPVTPQPPGTHCSVLIKVTNDFSNLILAHTTWEDFVNMLRIYKVYELDFFNSRVSFSSYPALVTSVDDFYITSANLAITETTNGIFSPDLLAKIVPSNLLSWMRALLANVGASNCPQWVNIFGQYNSGTYNNQWMCVDYKLFTKGQPLKPNTFWIAEQIPGMIVSADKTDVLALGYWPSYNIPYFPEIYNISGFSNLGQWGDFYQYSLCPRAKIFRRDQSNVQTVKDMQTMIRYNNWKNDPFSEGNPCNSIASRCDLVQGEPKNPDLAQAAFGSVDGKIVDATSIQHGGVWAQSGPSWDQQPVFTWDDKSWKDEPHGGQPEVFKFGWEYMYSQFP